jgi:hypothetical protein
MPTPWESTLLTAADSLLMSFSISDSSPTKMILTNRFIVLSGFGETLIYELLS